MGSAQFRFAEKHRAEEVSATGTRVQRSDYSATTPVTVIDEKSVRIEAPANLSDYQRTKFNSER